MFTLHTQTLQTRLVLQKEDLDALEAYDSARPLPLSINDLEGLDDEQREGKWELLNDRQLLRFTLRMYESGRYSPTYKKEALAMPGIEILDEQTDSEELKTVCAYLFCCLLSVG